MKSSSRYRRAAQFSSLGDEGQAQIERSRVLLCGCGALGSMIAERLVRSGVGYLRIVDRDWVELSNLQRQTLFTEKDAAEGVPKAIAAVRTLEEINSQVTIEPIVEDISFTNIQRLGQDVDLILDGTDNFETRLLINDFCIQNNRPWVHGGCLGASGQIMTIVPGKTACFRCLVPDVPPRDAMPTCDTAGVLGPAIGIVASWQAAEALKILSGHIESVCDKLITIDTWNTSCRMLSLDQLRTAGTCPACAHGRLEFLTGQRSELATVLCGKNAVQLAPASSQPIHLPNLAQQLAHSGAVTLNPFLLRFDADPYKVTVFRDGRTIVEGTTEVAIARGVVAKWLGS